MPTPFGSSPYLSSNQNNKYLTVNDALRRQEIIASHVVRGTASNPVFLPSTGDSYLISTTPGSLWTGLANHIATWDGNAWIITAPTAMNWMFNTGTNQFMSYNGTNWTSSTVNNYNLGYQNGSFMTEYKWIGNQDIIRYSVELTTLTTNANTVITTIVGMTALRISFTAISPTRTYNANTITGTPANNIEVFTNGGAITYFIGSALGITELRLSIEYYL